MYVHSNLCYMNGDSIYSKITKINVSNIAMHVSLQTFDVKM